MRLLLVLATFLALGACQLDDIELCEGLFKELLALDGMELDEEEFDYRLGIFTSAVLDDGDLDGDDDFLTGPTILDMYTEVELYDMNHGGGIDARMEEEMLEMRARGESESHFSLEKRAPPAYDSTRSVRMNDVVSQGICGNCYLHTFIGALEIAYSKQTGKVVKFSEQELTDCYYKGCHGGDFRSVTKTLAINDKLSSKAAYGPYLNERDKNKRHTCKAATTPDALLDIKIVGVIDVTAATVNDAISTYGSVMTCMDWSNQCAAIGKKYRGGIFRGPTVKDGCEHAVLIVGYTSSYYKVRNSHGKSFGEGGYFRIQRGNNACGIEDQMAAIVTERRSGKAGIVGNGCPVTHPNYCPKTFLCAAGACVNPSVEVKVEKKEVAAEVVAAVAEAAEVAEVVEVVEVAEVAEVAEVVEVANVVEVAQVEEILAEVEVVEERIEEIIVKKRHARDLSLFEEAPVVEVAKRCAADKSRSCARYKSRCSSSSIMRICATTCGCGAPSPPPRPKPSVGEPKGPCSVPKIANGRVMAGSSIPAGGRLNIRCNSGYKLEGDPVTCMIQDTFSPDSRLMPECVKVGSETLVGNGADYTGTKDSTVDGRRCMSWNKEIIQGYVPIETSQASVYQLGNHNFCRNAGGVMPLPWCIVDTAGNMGFCFKYPGCSVCGGGDTDKYCDEYSRDCAYSRPDRMNRPKNAWAICPATCCATAGC